MSNRNQLIFYIITKIQFNLFLAPFISIDHKIKFFRVIVYNIKMKLYNIKILNK